MAVNKIDSNITGLRYAKETSLGVLPVTPDWVPLEPNSYADFGGQISTVSRNPINPGRQRKKGVVTDLDASGGFNSDFTYSNLQDLLQGFFFADARRKAEVSATGVTALDVYELADTTGIQVGSLVLASGFSEVANNGLKEVTAISANVSITVAEALAAEAAPPAGNKLVVVGFAGATADLNVDTAGTLPALTSTALDFTSLGLTPGEWIYIGDDTASNRFVNSANNGFKRVRSIAANRLEFDKSTTAMVAETGTSLGITLLLGRMLRNEIGATIKRQSYQLERTLGAPDEGSPSQIQSEYLVGCLPSEMQFSVSTADKITVDVSFMGIDHETRTGVQGVKSGNRPALVDSDAYNSSSDFTRMRLSRVVAGQEAPDPLFAFVTDLSLTINNSLSANKAVGVLGSFDITAGTFLISGSMTAYFADVAAVTAVRQNADITLDFSIVKGGTGVVVDIPLITLSDGRANVEQDRAIMLPLSMEGSDASKIDPNLDYTLSMIFFDYLPEIAETV